MAILLSLGTVACTFPFVTGYHNVVYTVTGTGDYLPDSLQVTLSNTKITGSLVGGETFTGLNLPFTKTYSVYFDASNKFVAQASNVLGSGTGTLRIAVKIEGVSDTLGVSSYATENTGTGTVTTNLDWPKEASW